MKKPIYKRILVKLSGEAFQGDKAFGIDPLKLDKISTEISDVVKSGVQVAMVVGAGNIIRGSDLCMNGFDRVTADQMGMLATVINGLALRDVLKKHNVDAIVMSAIPILGLVDTYNRANAIYALEKNIVTIFVAGTSNPLVTTDSAAAIRGIEIGADIVVKATKVDGVFAADPIKNPKAERYASLTYDAVLEQRLGVMDFNAILLCRDNHLPLRVFNMGNQGALQRIVLGEEVGTLIRDGETADA